jgi:hypothetical protein
MKKCRGKERRKRDNGREERGEEKMGERLFQISDKGVVYHLVSIMTGFCFCETSKITKVKTKNFRTVCDRGINSSSEISVK